MFEKKLNENWQMKISGKEMDFIPATVPGSVYSALLDAKLMEDPYYRDNELEALKLMENNFLFKVSFDKPEELNSCDVSILRFEGLDTICDIFLNEKRIGHTENMHRTYEFIVTDLLKEKDNELCVGFKSPTKFAREKYEENGCEGTSDAMKGFPSVRKTHCMYGWDWGARIPDAGIWRDVKLLGVKTARIESVYVSQKHFVGKIPGTTDVEIDLSLNLDIVNSSEGADKIKSLTPDGSCEIENLVFKAEVISPEGKVYERNPVTGLICIDNASLWWPNGYGAQPLYTVKVTLMDGNEVLDVWEKRIGLRTMTVERKPDEIGESFAHMVNGVTIFAMGANYIPEDSIFPRITKERIDALLKECKDANYNIIRVWGGGYYASDDFYDLCDEYGLLVWQDFLFACGIYELTPEFHENLKQEFIDNVKRIRHHASLALWCGNNEVESAYADGWWGVDGRHKGDYIRIFEYLIPSVLREYDPDTFYWPSSPSSGGGFDKTSNVERGDAHYWDVWHGNKPFTDYRKYKFRYVSEFGFESFPAFKTVESFTLPEDRNIFSYVMEKHQRCNGANGKIINYMAANFKMPKDFEMTLYVSQLLQAEAIKYGVEYFRRSRSFCKGAIYWQLNDCWPVASWSSIDYFGRRKALFEYSKRFFAPVLLSCEEEGVLTQNPYVNAEPYEVVKAITLCVTNETLSDKKCEVSWSLRNSLGEIKREETEIIDAPALKSTFLERKDLSEAELFEDYVYYSLKFVGSDEIVSEGTVIFTLNKYYNYKNPYLTVEVQGDEIVVTSKAYAKSVEIRNENEDLKLSDNFFDMNPGEKRVKLVAGELKNLSVRSVFDIA